MFLVPCSLLLAVAGCSPDDPSMGGMNYAPGDLQEGRQYKVDINTQTNEVTLHSLIDETPCWILQDGSRSQKKDLSVKIAFAGHYKITFGCETPGGYVFADKPYEFDLTANDMSLVTDDFWTFLTGGLTDGATHCEKVWVPVDRDYQRGLDTNGGYALASINPDNVDNQNTPWEKLVYGSFVTNYYECGNDPDFLNSTMTFALDNEKGSVVTCVNAKKGETVTGTFSLNLNDMTKPTISFAGDAYLLNDHESHGESDYATTNWKDQLQIVRLDKQTLQVAVLRQPAKWGVLASFVSLDVKEGRDELPAKQDFTQNPVKLPTFEDITKDFYKTNVGANPVDLGETTWLLNDDEPYDFMWWNATSGAFESVIGGADNYGSEWAPKYTADFELFVKKAQDKDGNPINSFEFGESKGTVELTNDGLISFYNEDGTPADLTFLDVKDAKPAFDLKGSEFQIIKLADDELIFGVPTTKNDAGADDRYRCIKLLRKAEGGSTGPVEIKFDLAQLQEKAYREADWKAYRLVFLNTWGGTEVIPVDKLKLKKNKQINITFNVTGLNFKAGAKPKAALIHNVNVGGTDCTWEMGCFADDFSFKYEPVVPFVEGQNITISLLNDTGGTLDWGNGGGGGTFQVCIQLSEDGTEATALCAPDEEVKINSCSVSIQ